MTLKVTSPSQKHPTQRQPAKRTFEVNEMLSCDVAEQRQGDQSAVCVLTAGSKDRLRLSDGNSIHINTGWVRSSSRPPHRLWKLRCSKATEVERHGPLSVSPPKLLIIAAAVESSSVVTVKATVETVDVWLIRVLQAACASLKTHTANEEAGGVSAVMTTLSLFCRAQRGHVGGPVRGTAPAFPPTVIHERCSHRLLPLPPRG